MPWVTAVLASTFRSSEQRDVTVTLYLAVLVLMGWTFNGIWFSARSMGLVDDSNPEETNAISRSYPIDASVMTAAFPVSIVSAVAALVIHMI
jgi:hypothetical protein